MGWVDTFIDVKQIISQEEENFIKLLVKFKDLNQIKTPEEAFILRTTHGCPEELIQDILTNNDFNEYKKILEESKELNRSKTIKRVY